MRGLGTTREAGRHRCEHCNERKARQTTLHSHLRVELAPPYSNDRARDLDCRLGCYASGQDYDVWFARGPTVRVPSMSYRSWPTVAKPGVDPVAALRSRSVRMVTEGVPRGRQSV